MEYDYQKENNKAQQFVKGATLNFKPEDAVLVNALSESAQHASGEHYTFSCLVTEDLRCRLEPITKQLGITDSSLLLNDPELYHLTAYWCNLNQDIDHLLSIFKSHLQKEPLVFNLSGLICLPFGISLKAYPASDNFYRLRQELWAATDQVPTLNPDGSLHERAVSTWINLARYTQPPSEELIKYIQSNLNLELGTFKPESFGVYLSNNKYLRDAKLIEVVRND